MSKKQDWNPAIYSRFADLRLRPALDLLAQVPDLPDGPVVDLGCGSGAVGGALAQRWPRRDRVGVDASPAMLAEAEETGHYTQLSRADITEWQPDERPALIFSNAALHWIGDHPALMTRLARLLTPGGTMAVQMPRQSAAPSHRFLRDIAVSMFPDRFDFSNWHAPVSEAESYYRMLEPLGHVVAWQTDYVQHLAPSSDGHPVRKFTEATAMRPFVEKLTETEERAFVHAYDEALSVAYPLLAGGGALFPFRRIFFTVTI